jgi:hypothetical protein
MISLRCERCVDINIFSRIGFYDITISKKIFLNTLKNLYIEIYPITVRNNRYENSFKFLTINLADICTGTCTTTKLM